MIKIKNFTEDEFECKCGCGLNNMDSHFLIRLEKTRIIADIPFILTSACRCKQHNKNEGGEDDSEHLTGEAVDVETTTSRDRDIIVDAAKAAGITRRGIGKSFTHLGEGKNKVKKVMWVY